MKKAKQLDSSVFDTHAEFAKYKSSGIMNMSMKFSITSFLLLIVPILGSVLFYFFLMWLFGIVWITNPSSPQTPIVPIAATSTPAKANPSVPTTPISLGDFHYIEVTDSCDWEYIGTCVNLRSGPGMQFPVVERLRTGVVLKVASTVTIDGHDWYKINPGSDIRYADRITSDWYVYADAVQLFSDTGDENVPIGTIATTTKRIIVDIAKEQLSAYDGDILFMQEPISTGLEYTPTPQGTFSIFRKTPARYMQGPLPGVSDQVYDLPGVPWDLYFTSDGAVIHGAYWHNQFGKPWSHGCVNLSPANAKKLYYWADIGTPVIVQN